MQFEAEWHAVPSGLLCCLAGIYNLGPFHYNKEYKATGIFKNQKMRKFKNMSQAEFAARSNIVVLTIKNEYGLRNLKLE